MANLICSEEYAQAVREFRREWPTMVYKSIDAFGTIQGYVDWPKDLPRICFALEQENRNHELVTKGYTGLVPKIQIIYETNKKKPENLQKVFGCKLDTTFLIKLL